MKPATKELLKWLGKRVGGWMLFMAVTLTVMSNLRGSSPSTLETVLFWVFTIPSWGLPFAFAFAGGSHSPDGALGLVGLIVHFLLWVGFWEWRAKRAQMTPKPFDRALKASAWVVGLLTLALLVFNACVRSSPESIQREVKAALPMGTKLETVEAFLDARKMEHHSSKEEHLVEAIVRDVNKDFWGSSTSIRFVFRFDAQNNLTEVESIVSHTFL